MQLPRQEWRSIAGVCLNSNSAVGTLGTLTNTDETERPCHISDRGMSEPLALCPPQQAVATLSPSASEGPLMVDSCGPLPADSASVPQHASPTIPPSDSNGPHVVDSTNCGLPGGPPPFGLAAKIPHILKARKDGLTLGPSVEDQVRPSLTYEDCVFSFK